MPAPQNSGGGRSLKVISQDRGTEGVEGEECTSPPHPTSAGLGSVISYSGVRGGAPAENGFLGCILKPKSHPRHHFVSKLILQ